jgi:NADH dehydrogenase
MAHRVVIVGGGFGGVAAALALQKQHDRRLDITLVSDRPHFEYHAALYRVVAGHSPLEVCIPLSTIFPSNDVKVVEDKIAAIDTEKNLATGQDGARYHYDSLVFAVGSQTQYFGVPGLDKYSSDLFCGDSLQQALHLLE